MKKAAALAGDKTLCPAYSGSTPHISGVIQAGAQNKVYYKGKPLAVVNSMVQCHTPDAVASGSEKFRIQGKPVARHQDTTAHNATIVASGSTLTIG